MGNLRFWSTTAGDNDDADPTQNWLEGQAPSTVNNSARAGMATIATQYALGAWHWVECSATASVASQTVFKLGAAAGDLTAHFHASRRVRLTGGSSTRYATISSASFTAETTVTIAVDSGSLSASHNISALGPAVTNSPVRVLASMIDSDYIADATPATVLPADLVEFGDVSAANATRRTTAGALGWTLIEDSGALGSVASYTKDAIDSSFTHLRITFSLRPATDGAALLLNVRKGAGTDITSYQRAYLTIGADVVTGVNDVASSVAFLSGGVENTAPGGVVAGEVVLENIQSADNKAGGVLLGWLDSTSGEQHMFSGRFQANDTAVLTGIKLIFNAGNIAAGRVRVEGC